MGWNFWWILQTEWLESLFLSIPSRNFNLNYKIQRKSILIKEMTVMKAEDRS